MHVYLAPLHTGERKVSSYVLVAWCIQLLRDSPGKDKNKTSELEAPLMMTEGRTNSERASNVGYRFSKSGFPEYVCANPEPRIEMLSIVSGN